MKKHLSLLIASTTLTIAAGLPVLALTPVTGTALFSADDRPVPLIRVSGDDDEGGGWLGAGQDDDDDDEGDCDDEDCGTSARNAAPAGTVAPPANGLFGNGAPPRAVTN